MADNILTFPGVVEPTPGPPDEPTFDPNVLATLEAALEQARAGEIVAFVMVFERPDGSTDPLYDTTGSRNLKLLLAELTLEQQRLAQYVNDQIGATMAPEGA